ncbi:MAG TPA: hypothetical protein VFU31_04710 [Candidatus Binatia bacterium]|nr:hypothetical protein [Candidatus Binatia bacterium]
MRRPAIRTLSILAVLLLSAYIGLYLLAKSQRFQRWLTAQLAQRTGYTIEVGGLSLQLPLRFVASGVQVFKSAEPILQAPQIVITLSPWDFISKTIHRIQLNQPILYFDARQLLDSSTQGSLGVAIRHLTIYEGALILKTGDARSIDFRSVSLSANDLNLGQTIGLTFRAELPWLKSQAEISVRSQAGEAEAEIRIHHTLGNRVLALPGSNNPSRGHFRANVKLRKNKPQGWVVVAAGDLNQFMIGPDTTTGEFDIKTEIDPAFQEAAFAGRLAVTEFTRRMGSIGLTKATQPATATFGGHYSISDQLLHLHAVHLQSAWGTAEATAAVGFAPRVNLAKGRATLRQIPIEALQQFFPEPLRALAVKGIVESELEFAGPWPTVEIKGIARSHDAQIASEKLSLARLSFSAPFVWTNGSVLAREVQIQANSLSVNRRDRATFAADEIRINAVLEKKPADALNASGKMRILRGRFAAGDGSKVGEKIDLNAHFDTRVAAEKQVTSLAGNLRIDQGELLWGRFFGDLRARRPAADFDLDYAAADDTLRLRRLSVSLAGIGSVDITGNVERVTESPLLRLDLKTDDLQPAGAFDYFIRDTLKRSYPILDRLRIAGRMNFSVRLDGSAEQWTGQGNMHIRAGEVRDHSDKWQIGPFDLVLPFRVQLPVPPSRGEALPAIPTGTLAITSARVGSESIPPLRTTVAAWNNALEFRQTIPISIYGGTIEIGNLRWQDFINHAETVAFSLSAKNLQLQKLTEDLGWYRFAGTLSGSIPNVESTGSVLRTQGEMQMEVFGGKVRIAPVEVKNPFSGLFSVRLNARFEDIHLELASETFEFGRISGIVEGSVNDLIVTSGQPAQFIADLQTVAKTGASQWISVEALNKITVLSSGNEAGALYGGLATFFDNFRYSKLGFKATLKNDNLMLRGIESRDGKEYLVVGTLLPPTVNIISHTQQIGFGELLRRLERITESGSPQIK